jgi:hypothetical protein
MGDALSTLLAAVRSVSSGGVALAPRVSVPGGPVDGAVNFTGGLSAAPNAVTGQSDVSIPTGAAGTVLGTNGSGVVTYVPTGGLFCSPVDCATGYGAAGTNGIELGQIESGGMYQGRTCGVGFGVTQAGHFCTGARFWWGNANPLAVTLWRSDGAKLATVGTTGGNGAVKSALFASPIALTPGLRYAITFYDTTPENSNPALGPGFWHYAGGSIAGQTNMSLFMVSGGNQTVQWGPFIAGADFIGGSSPNDIYGLDFNFSTVDTCPNESSISWYPIEPVVS